MGSDADTDNRTTQPDVPAVKRPFIPQGCDQQGRQTPTIMKNYQTPRQLSDCQFHVGHPQIDDGRATTGERILCVFCVVAILGAALLALAV